MVQYHPQLQPFSTHETGPLESFSEPSAAAAMRGFRGTSVSSVLAQLQEHTFETQKDHPNTFIANTQGQKKSTSSILPGTDCVLRSSHSSHITENTNTKIRGFAMFCGLVFIGGNLPALLRLPPPTSPVSRTAEKG